jgi:hypothetical protein
MHEAATLSEPLIAAVERKPGENLSITHNSAFLLRDGIWLVLELLESLVIHC